MTVILKFFKSALLKASVFLATTLLLSFNEDTFKNTQMKYAHVKAAYAEKWQALEKLLKEKKINSSDFEIYLRVFKYEKKLEVWARNISKDLKYTLIKNYNVCDTSGKLGPKRKEGDKQIPEGFYEIDLLNPTSNYYLSMRVNYPNSSDRLLGNIKRPGGAIMVHGNCVTIGCIPINDEGIKEVYILAVETKNQGHKIPIDIFPCYFNEKKDVMLKKNYSIELNTFWEPLRKGYTHFENKKYRTQITTAKTGKYIVKDDE